MARSLIPSRPGEATAMPLPVRWSSWLFCTVVALAPLPLGSVGAVAPAIWSILLGIALFGALPVRLRGSQIAILAAVSLLTALAMLVLHDQLAGRPWLPVTPNALWPEAGKLLSTELQP